jgi:hypothetical protein
MIGTALTSEWKASTRMSQYIERIKNALNSKQRHLVMMEHRRGGTYISNQLSNVEALHKFFICCRKNPQYSPARLGTKKKSLS